MNLRVQDLCIEVTRRCNMACEHCLRGDAQDLDIPLEYIKKAIEQIDEISSITFTGGEPSLNIPAIRYFFEELERQGKYVSWFYLVTNGKENQLELAIELLKAHQLTAEPDMDAVCMSIDMFHSAHKQDMAIKGLAFYREDKEHTLENDKLNWIINAGRARDNGFGDHDNRTYQFPDPANACSLDTVELERLYISANGNVVYDGDMSFDEIDEEMEPGAKFHIDTLREDIRKWAGDELIED